MLLFSLYDFSVSLVHVAFTFRALWSFLLCIDLCRKNACPRCCKDTHRICTCDIGAMSILSTNNFSGSSLDYQASTLPGINCCFHPSVAYDETMWKKTWFRIIPVLGDILIYCFNGLLLRCKCLCTNKFSLPRYGSTSWKQETLERP